MRMPSISSGVLMVMDMADSAGVLECGHYTSVRKLEIGVKSG
jgi:hypothetical protein